MGKNTLSAADESAWLNIQKIAVSERLVKSPVALANSKYGYTAKMENIYRAQGHDLSMTSSKTVEINTNHPIVHSMLMKHRENPEDPALKDTARLLLQTAILSSGYQLLNPTEIVSSVHELLSKMQSLDMTAEVTKEVEVELPEPEPEDADVDIDLDV